MLQRVCTTNAATAQNRYSRKGAREKCLKSPSSGARRDPEEQVIFCSVFASYTKTYKRCDSPGMYVVHAFSIARRHEVANKDRRCAVTVYSAV